MIKLDSFPFVYPKATESSHALDFRKNSRCFSRTLNLSLNLTSPFFILSSGTAFRMPFSANYVSSRLLSRQPRRTSFVTPAVYTTHSTIRRAGPPHSDVPLNSFVAADREEKNIFNSRSVSRLWSWVNAMSRYRPSRQLTRIDYQSLSVCRSLFVVALTEI